MADNELLAAVFGSEAFARVLAVFADRPGELLAAGEVERLSGVTTRDTLYRAINRGIRGGLLVRRRFGRTGAYEINTKSPLYPDIKSLLSKAAGLAVELQAVLARHPGARTAFIFGSAAAGNDTAASDVDVFVIGEVSQEALVDDLRPLEERLGREVHPTILSPEALGRRLAIGDTFLANIWRKPRIMLLGDEDSLPRLPAHEPGPYFHQEMATPGTARTYAAVVVAGLPGTTDETTEQAIDLVEEWIRDVRPDARVERASPQVGWWQVVPPAERAAVWQTWLYPGPVISVRRVAPATPRHNDAAVALRDLATWWLETLVSVVSIVRRLGCDTVQVGLSLNPYGSGNEPRLIDVDFAGITEPLRGSPPTLVAPWEYTTRPLDARAPVGQIVVAAARSLLRHYSFRHLEDTIRSLAASLPGPEGG